MKAHSIAGRQHQYGDADDTVESDTVHDHNADDGHDRHALQAMHADYTGDNAIDNTDEHDGDTS